MGDDKKNINNIDSGLGAGLGAGLGDELEEVQVEQIIKSTMGEETEDDETEVETDADPDAETDAEPDAESEPEPDAESDAEPDAPESNKEEINKGIKTKPKTIRRKKPVDIYHSTMITKKVSVPIGNIGKNLSETLEAILRSECEGRCIAEGYVKPNSTKILTYSSGLINSDSIVFEVILECMICLPVEGMHIECNIKNITRAGIRAETSDTPSPVVIFVARDHSTNSKYTNLSENQEITVRVVGQRFELNDKYISIIAEVIGAKKKKKPITINE